MKKADNKIAKKFAETLRERLGDRVKEIILFGSRARGEANSNSDWDILIVVAGSKLKRKERLDISKLSRRIFIEMGALADIIVLSETEKDHRADKIYTVTHQAYSEGIMI